VLETQDIIWLRRMYFEKPIINQDLAIAPVIDDDYEVEKEPTIKVGEGLDDNDSKKTSYHKMMIMTLVVKQLKVQIQKHKW